MGLRTALLLTVVVVLISSSQGRLQKKRSSLPTPVADGTKSMEVIMGKSAEMREPSKRVIKGPPCDELFSWTYIRPDTAMKIRSRWLGKAMNFPDICGWSFWTDAGHKLNISCKNVDIRVTDYLTAHDFKSDAEVGWQGVQIPNLHVMSDVTSQEIAFGLESNQVRDKRSFKCTVTAKNWCVEGQFWCPSGDHKCIGLEKVCNDKKNPDCDNGEDEPADCPESSPPCPEGFASCTTGECRSPYYICDGLTDCIFYSGVENCPPTTDSCPTGKYVCNDHTCILKNQQCNLTFECTDGGDELNCGSTACPEDYFQCSDASRCIPPYAVCDSTPDCTDGSDEDDCVWKTNELIN